MKKINYMNKLSKKMAFQIYVECILKIGRYYYFNLTHVGLKYDKLKSDEFTRDIYLATLRVVEILLFFFSVALHAQV